ncbi:MAG TPA: hypothetical protein VL625_00615, partial [Patescibacteria group bacterium]|nr:hypothetical protein [Patescibacteria group bacterium]
KEPVLTLPPAETTSDAPEEKEPVVDDKKPVAAAPEIAGPTPGVDEASKKKFDDLLTQEKKLLQVDYLARKGSYFGDEPAKEWDSQPDDAARANLFNHAWQYQKQMHDRVIADQEAHKAPPAAAPVLELNTPTAVKTNGDVAVTPQVVAQIPPAPEKPAAVSARKWEDLSSTEQGVLLASDPQTASQWDKWDAETRDELYRVALLEAEQKPKAVEADQQTNKPVVIATTPPPVAAEAEKFVMPPETDTEFDAALQAKGHSRADLATMGVEQARDLIATIRKEQEAAKQAGQQPAAAESITPKFTNSVLNVFQTKPDQAIMDRLHEAKVTDEFYFSFREKIIKDRKVSANRAHDLGISWEKAKVVIQALKDEGIIGEDPDTHRRYVIAERDGTLHVKNPPQTPPTPNVS